MREEEKSRLARDIHDELGGILVGAKMDVAWAAQRCKTALPEAAEKLERAIAVLDEGVEMKRRIIEELRPTLLDNLGISSALDWQVRQVCERAGLQCELNLAELELPSDASIAIYRIVQEALTNIVKYASARNVDVELARRCRRCVADRARRRRRPACRRRIESPVARHHRHAPARARAERHIQDQQPSRQRHDDRSVHSAADAGPDESAPTAATSRGCRYRLRRPLSCARTSTRSPTPRAESERRGRATNHRKTAGAHAPAVCITLIAGGLRLAEMDLRVLDALVLRGAAHRVALLDGDLVLRVARVFARFLAHVGPLLGASRLVWSKPSSTFASALAFVCAAFACFTQTSFWLPDRSSHFSFATS